VCVPIVEEFELVLFRGCVDYGDEFFDYGGVYDGMCAKEFQNIYNFFGGKIGIHIDYVH